MVEVGDLKKNMFVIYEGEVYRVLESTKHFRARGSGQVRVKMKNVKTGYVRDVNFMSGEKLEEAQVSFKKAQYLYRDGDHYYFMTLDDYEQYPISSDVLGDAVLYLTENLELSLVFHDDTPIGVELPTTVVLEVVDTPPGYKGDTASGGGKPATLETGLKVTVPFFVEIGDKVRVDTRTGEYVEKI